MFFNANLFDEVGQPHPPGDYADPTWTWDRFLAAAQKLTRDKGGVSHFGLESGTGFRQWMPWVHGNGGELVDKDCATCVLHEPPAVEALQFLQDLRVRHRVWATPPDAQQGATFPLGRVGVAESAPPGVGTMRRQAQGFLWDATHVPRGAKGKYAASGGGTGQAIHAGTPNPEEAWALLEFVLSPEALYLEIVKDQLNMPGRKSQATSKEYLNSGQPPKSIKVFVDGLPFLRPDPQTTNWDEIDAALTRELAPLWSGDKSPREVALAVKRAVDPLLQQSEAKRRL
jgi:multiple sugar transport system substrate-binding protein